MTERLRFILVGVVLGVLGIILTLLATIASRC